MIQTVSWRAEQEWGIKMRKNKSLAAEFIIGVIAACAGAAVQIEYYGTMLFAMGFGLALGAFVQLVRIYYWSRPERREAYEEKRKAERIDRIDERKQYMRMRAAQVSAQIMLIVLLLLDFVLALLRVEAWVISMVAVLFLLFCAMDYAAYRVLEKRM